MAKIRLNNTMRESVLAIAAKNWENTFNKPFKEDLIKIKMELENYTLYIYDAAFSKEELKILKKYNHTYTTHQLELPHTSCKNIWTYNIQISKDIEIPSNGRQIDLICSLLNDKWKNNCPISEGYMERWKALAQSYTDAVFIQQDARTNYLRDYQILVANSFYLDDVVAVMPEAKVVMDNFDGTPKRCTSLVCLSKDQLSRIEENSKKLEKEEAK